MKRLSVLAFVFASQVSAMQFTEVPKQGLMRRFWTALPTNHALASVRWHSTNTKKPTVGVASKQDNHPVRISHPCIDGVFQHGFAEPSILSDFINAALNLKGNQAIKDIEYLPRDLPPSNPISDLGYHFTVDVRCSTRSGQHFLVEMQNDFRDDYHLKALIEHSRMISRLDLEQKSTGKGDKRKFWDGIQGIYSVVITNKLFDMKRKKKGAYQDEKVMEPFLVNPYELRHVNEPARHYGNIPHQIVLLMLANLNKKDTELSTPIERWAYLFKDPALGHGSVKIPETKEITNPDLIAGNDEAIKHFIERIKEENIPLEVRDSTLRQIRYYNNSILDIEEKAVERGELKAKQDVARNLIAKTKLTDDEIAGAIGLTLEEVQALRS